VFAHSAMSNSVPHFADLVALL